MITQKLHKHPPYLHGRFPQKIIEGLLEVEWCQYSDEVIRDLPVDNPAACIEMQRACSAAKQTFEPHER